MLMKAWEKLDKFYLVLGIVLTLMSVMVIAAFRTIFSAYLYAGEITSENTQISAEIQKESLDEAYSWATNKTAFSLQIRD